MRHAAALGAAVMLTVIALTACGAGSKTSPPSRGLSSEPSAAAEPRVPESNAFSQASVLYPGAPTSQATKPTVSPASGSTKDDFTVVISVRTPPGPHGRFRHSYRVLLNGIRPRCDVFTDLETGSVGKRSPVSLQPPIELGWCPGPYEGTVLLATSPNCPPGGGKPCRLFAPRYAVTGRFRFVVR